MNGTKFRISAVGAILLASVTAPIPFYYHAQVQWREREALFEKQAGQIQELLTENKRLSDLVARVANSALSHEEFHELLRLRGEIGRLRREASELTRLRATHQQRHAASAESESQSNAALTN